MKSKKAISIIMAMILLVSSFALDSGYSVKGSVGNCETTLLK